MAAARKGLKLLLSGSRAPSSWQIMSMTEPTICSEMGKLGGQRSGGQCWVVGVVGQYGGHCWGIMGAA